MNRRETIHIRNHVEDFDDPYIADEHLEDFTVCKRCGDVYKAGRWYSRDMLPEKMLPEHISGYSTCPACQKQRDRYPGGVIKITGSFFSKHQEEVMNLIRNETEKAQGANPLERVMGIESSGDTIEITTTNEGLAQRLGKALHKAYRGDIEYKWSEDNKVARINWHRDA